MSHDYAAIRAIVRAVRRRWMWHTIFRCGTRAALACALVLLTGSVLVRALDPRSAAAVVGLSIAIAASLAGVAAWGLWPLTRRPNDARVARFAEERCPQLEDSLVSAVECASRDDAAPAGMLADLLYRDAAARARGLDLDQTIRRSVLVRAGILAAAATIAAAGVLFDVTPDMIGRMSALRQLRPAARARTDRRPSSPAVRLPEVTAIDVHYQYPTELRLPARTEEGTGDVYAPSGTRVQLRIHTDRPVRGGSLLVAGDAPAPLSVLGDRLLGAALVVSADGSYRVGVTDTDGRSNPGDVEYFIRMLADTPPDVRIVQPAADRQVTPLEEVSVAARAEDDHGVKDFDLVYSVRGGPEVAVPFSTRGNPQAVDGERVLYLEDLHVRPGDFISYYARARDATRRGEGGEARSDIFFLQVTPFEQEFMPPQSSQASSGGVGAAQRSIDDLIRAQKEILVATFRLDRRARKSHAAGSEADVKTIARAQGELKQRALALKEPRVSVAMGGQEPGGGDPMANAIDAMGKAEESLDAVNTTAALTHENRALGELLKAQASTRRWQMQQASRGGSGDNSASNADLTTLFDQELQRQQRTNYEMPRGSAQNDAQRQNDALERLRQLAQRQDELTRQQQELARDRAKLGEDEVKRQLERLTREQAELRRDAEQLSRETKSQPGEGGRGSAKSQGGEGGAGSPKSQRGQGGALGEASEAMRQSASSLRDGKLDEASARSGQASAKLRSAEQQMRGQGRGAPTLGDLQMEARQLADAQAQIAREAGAAGTGKGAADTMRRLAGEKERLADQAEQLQHGLKSAAASPGLDGRQRQLVDSVNRDVDRLQLPKQMRDAAAAMRAPEKGDVNRPPSAEGELDLAKTLGRLADRMAVAAGSRDTGRTMEQLGQTRDTRDRLAQIERRIAELKRDADARSSDARGDGRSSTDASAADKAVGTSGRAGRGEAGADALKRLQDEYARELRRAADQLNRLGADGGGSGLTPESARALSPMSAPGFHQDYSKWEQLAREINGGLDRAESTLTKKLQQQQARDRLQAASSARAPEAYRRLVEQYYQSLAREKR